MTVKGQGIDYEQLMEKSDKSSNVYNGKRKRCSYHQSNSRSNEDCYQQQSESENSDNKKTCSSYHQSQSHSDDQCYHRRNGSRSRSSTDSKSTNAETFVTDSNVTGCNSKLCCKC